MSSMTTTSGSRRPRRRGLAGLTVVTVAILCCLLPTNAAGAELLQPPTDQFHGDRTAILKDPYGHVWVFLTHLEDLTPDEVARRAGELVL